MTFNVTLVPGHHTFSTRPDETLLEAGLAAGLLLPHSCRDGACGVCKARLLDGKAALASHAGSALSEADRAAGFTLLCRARAESDLTLEVRNVTRADDIPVKKLPCRVQALQRLAPDVMQVDVKLPASERFAFRAGQYVDFLLPDGGRRGFSIASAPHQTDCLTFHIRKIEGGRFTTQVFEQLKVRDILRFEGPLGSFFLREDSSRPIVLLAGGTGFAPIKAIVEHAIQIGLRRPITLYWGARDRAGLYLDALARQFEQWLPGLRYIPVLSAPGADCQWDGRTGLVHHAVMADYPDLSSHEVYACGAPSMIEAARQDFVQHCKLDADAFFADAFTFARPAGG